VKQNINPAVAAVLIVIVVVVAVVWGWRLMGPRTDGPKEPVNMGEMMKKSGQSAMPGSTNR
jgi:hypothetical protein